MPSQYWGCGCIIQVCRPDVPQGHGIGAHHHAKIAESKVELSADPKGKGKMQVNAMDENKVIMITEDANASGEEGDRLA